MAVILRHVCRYGECQSRLRVRQCQWRVPSHPSRQRPTRCYSPCRSTSSSPPCLPPSSTSSTTCFLTASTLMPTVSRLTWPTTEHGDAMWCTSRCARLSRRSVCLTTRATSSCSSSQDSSSVVSCAAGLIHRYPRLTERTAPRNCLWRQRHDLMALEIHCIMPTNYELLSTLKPHNLNLLPHLGALRPSPTRPRQ